MIDSITPECGPDYGFTQIEVHGKNFIDLGTDKAMCIFNGTIYSNATILNNNLLYCDSLPFQNQLGYSLLGSNGPDFDWYYLSVTIDGGVEIVNTKLKFSYYRQPKLMAVTPFGGLTTGGTPVTVNLTDLN